MSSVAQAGPTVEEMLAEMMADVRQSAAQTQKLSELLHVVMQSLQEAGPEAESQGKGLAKAVERMRALNGNGQEDCQPLLDSAAEYAREGNNRAAAQAMLQYKACLRRHWITIQPPYGN